MITIIGSGKFGQALSKLLGKNQHSLVDIEPDGTYSKKTIECIKKASQIVLCIPSEYLLNALKMLLPIIPQVPLLSCTKGLYDNLVTPTELIRQHLANPVATLIGPNLSSEIMQGKPAMTVIAGDFATTWAAFFNSSHFVVIVESDCIGNEFAGAVKNIIALGTGLIHGYYGKDSYNAMGSFISLAVQDINQLYRHKSAQPMPQVSFLGDLFATCMSDSSRNHHFGHLVGCALKENQPIPQPEQMVEGLRTLHIVVHYAKTHTLSIPRVFALESVFSGNAPIGSLFR